MKAQVKNQIRPGQSFAFVCAGHALDCAEVSVVAIDGKRITVARSSDIANGLLSPQGSRKRKLKTWTCTQAELA